MVLIFFPTVRAWFYYFLIQLSVWININKRFTKTTWVIEFHELSATQDNDHDVPHWQIPVHYDDPEL